MTDPSVNQSLPNIPKFTVNPSSAPGQLAAAFRVLLIAGTSWGVGKGYFSADIATALVAVVMIGAPLLWGQVKTWSTHQKLVVAAAAAPAEVAEVKGQS